MKRILVSLTLAACLLAGGAPALAAPPATGAALRAALPEPGEGTVTGTAEFVGQDATKSFNIAIVRGARGAVLAYVCNGTTVGRWLTGRVSGGVVSLSGAKGATLTATLTRSRAVGRAVVGGARLRFALIRADAGSGLRRLVARAGSVRAEAAWIVTTSGVTRGIATDGKKTIATSTADGNPAADDDGGVGQPPVAGGAPPEPIDPTLLHRFRCSRIVLAFRSIRHDIIANGNNTTANQQASKALEEKFRRLGCQDFTNL